MAGKLWDKILNIIGFEEEQNVIGEQDEMRSAQTTAVTAKENEMSYQTSGPAKVLILAPRRYEDVQEIANHLKAGRAVIVTLEDLDRDLAKRIVDFMGGVAYALNGEVQRVAEGIFVFAPQSVVVNTDSYSALREEAAAVREELE